MQVIIMEKILEKSLEKVPIDGLKNHLEIVMNALVESKDISILLRRRGDQIFVFYQKRYSDKVNEIFEKAQREYQRREKEGYSREQAFQDFVEAQQEISKYLQDDMS
jgi:hypothetical protein